MTAILTNNFRIQAAKDFLENMNGHPIVPPLTSGSHAIDRNHYMFVGRSRPWPTVLSTTPQTNELSPPVPTNSQFEETATWDAILGFKRIDSTLTTLVVPRYDWDITGNTIYRPYDDIDVDLWNHPTAAEVTAAAVAGSYTAGSFYVMTEDFHIFKCLSNNQNAKSTVKPSLPVAAPFIVQTGDGYRWKYLTTITPSQALYFLTDQWIPVKTLGNIATDGSLQWSVEQTAVGDSIDAFVIDNAGSGYTQINNGTLVSGTGTTAVLAVGASAVSGTYVNSTIFITSGTGAGTVGTITGYVGGTRTVTVSGWSIDNTSVYEILPTVIISGNGTGAVAKAKVFTTGPNINKIQEVVIISGGTGYSYATASIVAGAGSAAAIRAIVPSTGGHGKNIENDLGAWNTMIVVNLAYNEGAGDFPLSNDYRQIGIIRNLLNFDGTLANAATRIGSKSLLLGSFTIGGGGLSFLPDEDISGPGGTTVGTLVEYIPTSPTTGLAYFWQDSSTGYVPFTDGMLVTGAISGANGIIQAAGVGTAEVKNKSGKIVYIENRRPILRAPDQQEQIKAIVSF